MSINYMPLYCVPQIYFKAFHLFLQNSDAWAILGHVKFLMGDTLIAKDCYERTIAFINDASEMHSIYLRLASIYLQEERVRIF